MEAYENFHKTFSIVYRSVENKKVFQIGNFIGNQIDFVQLIKSNRDKFVVLRFFNTWNPFQRNIIEVEKELAKRYQGKVTFASVDCENMNTFFMQKLYKVLCSPTFILIKNGSKISTIVGPNFEELEKLIRKLIVL